MKKNGFKLHVSSRCLICNGFYKRQAPTLSFMTHGFVR